MNRFVDWVWNFAAGYGPKPMPQTVWDNKGCTGHRTGAHDAMRRANRNAINELAHEIMRQRGMR